MSLFELSSWCHIVECLWVLIPIHGGLWELCVLGGTFTSWLWLHFPIFFCSREIGMFFIECYQGMSIMRINNGGNFLYCFLLIFNWFTYCYQENFNYDPWYIFISNSWLQIMKSDMLKFHCFANHGAMSMSKLNYFLWSDQISKLCWQRWFNVRSCFIKKHVQLFWQSRATIEQIRLHPCSGLESKMQEL